MALNIIGVSIMDLTKDTLRAGSNQPSQALIDARINALVRDLPQLTHIAIEVPENTNAESIALGLGAFTTEPSVFAARFTTSIHNKGIGVLWRPSNCFFEGLYNFPLSNFRNGNRFTTLGTNITDSFSSTLTRNHGYGLTSAAGNVTTNYIYATSSSGNTWSISSNELVGPAGDSWKRAIYFKAQYMRDYTVVVGIKKVGNQSVVIRGQQNSANFPGYGLQLRSTNTIRIEDNGRSNLSGDVTKTLTEGNWYWAKLQGIGTAIKGKVWAADDITYPNSTDGSENEPGTWDIQITDSTYGNDLNGYVGLSGESDSGHFRHLTITPLVDNQSWMYRSVNFENTNHTLFATGDIIVPYPEADDHQPLNNNGDPNQFQIDLSYCITTVMASHGKTVTSGLFSRSFGRALQHAYDSTYAVVGTASMDHYGYSLGLGKKFFSWNGNSNYTGTAATYTVATSLSESNKFSFIPEKGAYNNNIEVFIENKGTGNWTMVIHDESNNPVKMYDHTNLSSSTNSYTVTIPNAQVTSGAYNVFNIDWVNLNPDVTYHYHLYSTVADGLVRVVQGHQGDLSYAICRGFKTNTTPESMEIDFRNLYAKVGVPIFIEEWGDFWSKDPTRSSPVRTQAQHEAYLDSMYAMFQRLINDGIVTGFCYWRAASYSSFTVIDPGYEGILYDADPTSGFDYHLNYAGVRLQTFYANNATAPSTPIPPSALVATTVSNTQINLSWTQNSSNELGFKIERKTGSGGTYAEIATVGVNVTTYSNTGLTGGTNYFYRVRAYNAQGNSAYTTEASATTQADPAPPPTVDSPTIIPNGGTFLDSVSVSILTSASPTAGSFPYYGVGLSGLEFGSAVPGTESIDFFQPTAANFAALKGAKYNIARLAFWWERMQPTLNGGLDAVYKAYIDTAIANAAANGIQIILDAHNFGRRYVLSSGGFTSNFSSADAMWTGGTISGGVLNVSNFGSASGGSVLNPASPATSYIYTTDVRTTARNGDTWNATWLQFFKTDANNFLAFTLHPVTNQWEFVKRVGGNDTVIASGALTVSLNTTYTVIIDAGQTTPGSVIFTVNGTAISTQSIPGGFSTGQIGIFVNGTTAWIDNVTLNVNGDTTLGNTGTGTFAVGTTYLTTAHFADFWSKMSTAYKNNTTVLAYDLMNEWHDMPIPLTSTTYNSTATSTLANQAATTAIRATGDTKYIIWEWDSYSNTHRGPGVTLANGGLFGPNPTKWWTDVLNKVVLSGHHYFDPDHSGQYTNPFVSSDFSRIAGEITPTLAWCEANNVIFLMGEMGVPPNDVNYVACEGEALRIMAGYDNVWVALWAMGNQYTSITKIDPTATTLLNPVLIEYAGSPVNIYYTVNGTTPTINSFLYSDPFTLLTTTTVRAFATSFELTDSAIVNATFIINQSAAPTVRRLKRRQKKFILASL